MAATQAVRPHAETICISNPVHQLNPRVLCEPGFDAIVPIRINIYSAGRIWLHAVPEEARERMPRSRLVRQRSAVLIRSVSLPANHEAHAEVVAAVAIDGDLRGHVVILPGRPVAEGNQA